MKHITELLASIIFALWWIGGIVLAHGFWSTGFAFFVPPWAMYLVVEKLIHTFLP